jgi:hypothetical protein
VLEQGTLFLTSLLWAVLILRELNGDTIYLTYDIFIEENINEWDAEHETSKYDNLRDTSSISEHCLQSLILPLVLINDVAHSNGDSCKDPILEDISEVYVFNLILKLDEVVTLK